MSNGKKTETDKERRARQDRERQERERKNKEARDREKEKESRRTETEKQNEQKKGDKRHSATVFTGNRCSAGGSNRGLCEDDGTVVISWTPTGPDGKPGDPCKIEVPFVEQQDNAQSVAKKIAKALADDPCAAGHVQASETEFEDDPYWIRLDFYDCSEVDIGSSFPQWVSFYVGKLSPRTPTPPDTGGGTPHGRFLRPHPEGYVSA